MKESYPIYLEQQSDGKYLVYIPDFDSYTEGKNENDALKMAWDLIGAMGIKSKPFSKKYRANKNEVMYMVEIDFDEYRKSLKDVRTWEDYKKHVRETNPEIAKDIDEAEVVAKIVADMIVRRKDLNLSRRELAELCGVSYSTVERIESFESNPNLRTLIKILNNLGMSLTVQPDV